MLDNYFKMTGNFHLTDNKENVNNYLRNAGLLYMSHHLSLKGTIARRKRSHPDTVQMLLSFHLLQSAIEFRHLFVNIKEL